MSIDELYDEEIRRERINRHKPVVYKHKTIWCSTATGKEHWMIEGLMKQFDSVKDAMDAIDDENERYLGGYTNDNM